MLFQAVKTDVNYSICRDCDTSLLNKYCLRIMCHVQSNLIIFAEARQQNTACRATSLIHTRSNEL